MKKIKDERLQLRINREDKAKLKYLAEIRGYNNNLSDYILSLVLKDIAESEFINKQMIKDFE